ncbi:MAG: hypothetical protein ACE5MH_11450, partial [Terriglobia bacterium]
AYLTNRALQATERAWIISPVVKVVGKPSAETGMTIHSSMKNSGRSPALQVEASLVVRRERLVGRTDEIINWFHAQEEKARETGLNVSQSNLGPGASITRRIKKEMSQEEFNAVMSGKLPMYVYGLITYRDVVAEEERTTLFCRMYRPTWNMFVDCPEHNYAT